VRQELVEFEPGSAVVLVRSRESERVKEVPLTQKRRACFSFWWTRWWNGSRRKVYELLSGIQEVKHLVRSHSPIPELFAAAQSGGMLSLRQCAIEKVLRGVMDLAGARAVSS
jgi:type II secretory ATPase GspE/PulE/Tfp pilus assembly ATPase PilB-like protein